MGTIKRVLLAATATAVLTVVPAAVADANGDDDSAEARVLVLQAIALIVNQPDDEHEIEERLEHAHEATHQEGVDLDLVEEAAAALHDGDHEGARELLQTSIGAGPFVSPGVPEPIREAHGEPGEPTLAVGAETGTSVVLDEYEPSSALDGGNIGLLVLSAAAIVVGALLAWLFRPRDTVRGLRRTAGS
jgi:hypothetical protein